KAFVNRETIISRTHKSGHSQVLTVPNRGAFTSAPAHCSAFSFIRFALSDFLLGVCCVLPCSVCLQACPAHIDRRCAGIVVKDFQTLTETVARDSIGEDVDLRSHLSSVRLGRLAWRRLSALKIDRSDLAQ